MNSTLSVDVFDTLTIADWLATSCTAGRYRISIRVKALDRTTWPMVAVVTTATSTISFHDFLRFVTVSPCCALDLPWGGSPFSLGRHLRRGTGHSTQTTARYLIGNSCGTVSSAYPLSDPLILAQPKPSVTMPHSN